MKKKNNFFWRSILFLILLTTACKSQNIRYTYLQKDSLQHSNKILLLSLYDEPSYPKIILINDNNGKQIYQSDGFINGEDKIVEFKIEGSVDYINIKYNNTKFKIKMDDSYKFIYIEFKSKEFLEIVYTNKRPVYT